MLKLLQRRLMPFFVPFFPFFLLLATGRYGFFLRSLANNLEKNGSSKSLALKSSSAETTLWDSSVPISPPALWDTAVLCKPHFPSLNVFVWNSSFQGNFLLQMCHHDTCLVPHPLEKPLPEKSVSTLIRSKVFTILLGWG